MFNRVTIDDIQNIVPSVTEQLVDVKVKLAFKNIKNRDSIWMKIIGKFTKSNFRHVEIIINDYWISSSVDYNGVRICKLDTLNTSGRWTYHDMPDAQMTKEQYINMFKFILDQKDCKYDVVGVIFSIILPFKWECRDKWFCSEITTKLLQILGYYDVQNLLPFEVTPGDLARLYGCNVPCEASFFKFK